MQSTRRIIVLILLLPSIPLVGRAATLYQYVGNPFQMAVGRYSPSDSLSGTIQVPSALEPNLTSVAIALDAWSFADGLKVFTAENSTVDAPMVSTDDAGRIVNWSFDFSGGAEVGVMGTFNNGPGDQIDQATDFIETNSLASNDGVPGSWALVPEPSSHALGALSLSLLAIAGGRLGPTR